MEELFKPEIVDARVIDDISKITGVKFSDEQLAILKHHGGMCILACAGSGKALKNGTGVLTVDGYKPIEKLNLFDKVYDQYGDERVVAGIFPQGKKEVYEIAFKHGKVIECSPDHLWSVTYNTMTGSSFKVMNTEAMYRAINNRHKSMGVPAAMPVRFNKNKHLDVPLDAYLVGFIAASDSFMTYNNIDSQKFSLNSTFKNQKQSEEMIDTLSQALNKFGLCVANEGIDDTDAKLVKYKLSIDQTTGESIKDKMDAFTKVLYHNGIVNDGCWNMNYIPKAYLYNDLETRHRLLNGIFDTAGYVRSGSLVIELATLQIVKQVEFLLESLGYWEIDNHNYKEYSGKYRLTIYLHKENVLPSKLSKFFMLINPRMIKHTATNKIVSIKKTDRKAEMTCIKVSGPSELFLTEHCIVTHNTSILTNLIAKRIMTHEIGNPEKLLCTTYSNPGADEMNIRLNKLLDQLGIRYKITVKTMHAVYLKVLREFGYPTTVVEARDRRKYINEACKDAQVDTDDETFQTIDSLLSFQINNLMNDASLVRSYAYTLPDVPLEKYTAVRVGFIKRKAQAGVIDFDDMQLYMYSLLYTNNRKDVIDYCHSQWMDIYVDEAQDLSRIQYAILRKMITDPNRLVVIGDDDQCLVGGTQLLTNNKLWVPIEDIKTTDNIKVRGYAGKASCENSNVDKGDTNDTIDGGFYDVKNTSSKTTNSGVIRITTSSGKQITATPEHLVFAKTSHRTDKCYLALFYKYPYGYKLGYLSSKITLKDGDVRNNLKIRMLQERTDRAYIIDSFDTETEACQMMFKHSNEYNLPIVRLNDLRDDGLKRVFDGNKGTKADALRLLRDKGIDYDYPSLFSRYTYNKSRVILEAFAFRGKDGNRDASRIKVITTDVKFKEILDGYNCTSSEEKTNEEIGTTYYRYTWFSHDIGYLEKTLRHIKKDADAKGLEVEYLYNMQIGRIRYDAMPFSNIKPGMFVPAYNKETGELNREEVVSVERLSYNGNVYDVEVDKAHNMLANGILVHNCIYQWRGADPSIILGVGVDYNELQRFTLTTNYRCAGTIVDHAANGVKFNSKRSAKQMKAFKPGGEIKICDCGTSNLYIMSKYAYKHIKELVIDKGVDPSHIAVLSRNNNHLSLLGNMLFKDGIHCEATNEMKMTKLFNYGAIKDVIELARDSKNTTLTENTLFNLCAFLGRNNAAKLANIQSALGLKFSELLGYIAYNFLGDASATYPSNVKASGAYYAKTKETINTLKDESKRSLAALYNIMSEPDMIKRTSNLLLVYIANSEWRWKRNVDKKRTVDGLVDYIIDLIKTMGYDEIRQYLKLSEQYEKGRMAVPGSKVCMSTMHSSKGKEWDYVVLFADDNVTFPSFSGLVTQLGRGVATSDVYNSIEEDRRLHYVAMTRARKQLVVFTDKSNVGVYLLEAMGIFNIAGNHNEQIVSMAQSNEVFKDLLQASDIMLFGPKSKFRYDIDISDICAKVEIDCMYKGTESKQTISMDDIQTAPPEKTYGK